MLTAEHLSVRYGEKTALRDLSFRVREGEWWSVVGPNGAGKSTLAAALSRSVPYEGSISLHGRDARSFSASAYARAVGLLSQQHAPAYGFTVEEVVSLGRYAYRSGFLGRENPEDRRKVDEALEQAGLTPMRNRRVFSLSGGELQRVFLAQVLCQDPELLILDEPANHLDLPFQKELFALIDAWRAVPGRAVITVLHDLGLARRFSSQALLLCGGECVAQGRTEEVLSPDHLRRVYGMDVSAWMRDLLSLWQE